MHTATAPTVGSKSRVSEKGQQAKVMFPPDQYAAVDEIAQADDRSFAYATRMLVAEALAARKAAASKSSQA